MKNLIEQRSLEIIKFVTDKWVSRFEKYSCSFGKVELNRSNNENKYFSEIETYVWKDNNVVEVLNIILYLNGEQLVNLEELESDVNKEIESIFSEISK